LKEVFPDSVEILSGADAGRRFTAITEEIQDVSMDGSDTRIRRVIRFSLAASPTVSKATMIKTEDGKKWRLTKMIGDERHSNNYEMVEVVTGKDT
jgi:hypothetical protein